MGHSYDCAASVLLCAEDNSSILGFDDGDEVETCVEVERSGVLEERCHLFGEMFLGMPLISEECLELLVKKELDHLPRSDYAERLLSGALDLVAIRTDAIDWISKAHAQYNFGPLSAYLAINFLDRFLSAYELPQGKAWMTQLLSVACLALAAKMDESEIPLSLDLQVGDSKYIFEARTIQRMELLVLSTLKWRLQSVTPFSYMDYFLHKFNDSKTPSTSSVSRSVELILSIMRGIDFLAFRPSEISAAVALSVLSQEQAQQKLEIDKLLTCYSHVIKKERVLRCCEMIQANSSLMNSIIINNNSNNRAFKNASSSGSFVPQSPIGVLDAACLSYKSDETTATNGIQANSDHTSPVNKKRRMNRHE